MRLTSPAPDPGARTERPPAPCAGAAKRSIVPTAYELVNTAYLDARRPEVCDPGVPLLGAGHRHQVRLTPAQQAELRDQGTLTLQTDRHLGHAHEVTVTLQGEQLTAALERAAEHAHDLVLEGLSDGEQLVWSAARASLLRLELRLVQRLPRHRLWSRWSVRRRRRPVGADPGEGDGTPD